MIISYLYYGAIITNWKKCRKHAFLGGSAQIIKILRMGRGGGGVWIVSKQIVLSWLCLQVYISQMRRGSSDCDQVPRRTEFHEHKQLEASCKQKTLLTCKSTHKDNKYLSKIQLFICGNIWPIFLHKKSPSLNLMTIVRNVFWIYPTILRWKGHHFYFFFSVGT